MSFRSCNVICSVKLNRNSDFFSVVFERCIFNVNIKLEKI